MPTAQPLTAYELDTNTCLYPSFLQAITTFLHLHRLSSFHRPLFLSGATSSHTSYPPNDLHIEFSLSEGVIPTDLRIHTSYPPTARFRRGRKTTPGQPPPPFAYRHPSPVVVNRDFRQSWLSMLDTFLTPVHLQDDVVELLKTLTTVAIDLISSFPDKTSSFQKKNSRSFFSGRLTCLLCCWIPLEIPVTGGQICPQRWFYALKGCFIGQKI
ncbi:hypothetical protein E3N88_12025 [Mikania micrantha]|uniref:Uncharacterized protein n=1 Tax=Mikania micrantha TaxID=192012 RepID=A0A5N6P6Y4_9ASTR|nr:hypothetical protein E3N88_12025 [Mikania micrantha]